MSLPVQKPAVFLSFYINKEQKYSLKIGNNWRVFDTKCVEKQVAFTSAIVNKGKVSYSRKLYVLKKEKRGKF